MHRNHNDTLSATDQLSAAIKRQNFVGNVEKQMQNLDPTEMNKYTLTNMEGVNGTKLLHTIERCTQFAELFSQIVNTRKNTPKEDELLKAIEEVQKKIEETVIKRKKSEMAVEHLNDRVNKLQEKLKDSEELVFLSKHPSEQEVELLKRLKYMAKERAHRSRTIKALEEQERIMKQSFMFAENVMKTGYNNNICPSNNNVCPSNSNICPSSNNMCSSNSSKPTEFV